MWSFGIFFCLPIADFLLKCRSDHLRSNKAMPILSNREASGWLHNRAQVLPPRMISRFLSSSGSNQLLAVLHFCSIYILLTLLDRKDIRRKLSRVLKRSSSPSYVSLEREGNFTPPGSRGCQLSRSRCVPSSTIHTPGSNLMVCCYFFQTTNEL